jgi:hypothetical protein
MYIKFYKPSKRPVFSIFILYLFITFSIGCSSSKKSESLSTPQPVIYKLKGYSGPEAMDKMEVVQAAKQCIYAKLRPNVEYVSVRTDTGSKVLVPVNVHCEPY